MNITFLVGNGFDKSLNVDTSYKGFYEWYKNVPSEKQHIKDFKKHISKDLENDLKYWSDFEIGLGKYTNNFDKRTVRNFLECHDDANEQLMNYLEIVKKDFNINSLENSSIEKIRQGLNDFYKELPLRDINTFESIFKLYNNQNININFISFNYTDLLDKVLKKVSKTPLKTWKNGNVFKMEINSNVCHVHGTLENPMTGVNDESQIAKKELLDTPYFKETVIKPISLSYEGALNDEKAELLIKNSEIICVFGMSMGETDAKWWEILATWLEKDSNRQLIIFYHTSSVPSKRKNFEYNSFIDGIKDKIADYSSWEKEKDKLMKKRIHIICNTKIVLQVDLKKEKAIVTTENIEKSLQESINEANRVLKESEKVLSTIK